jgi:hypothetical protein
MSETKNRIEEAWQLVKLDFEANRIPNEATLQAAFYAALRSLFREAQIVCGLAASSDESTRHYPDLMIIEGEQVIAAIEIKVPSREGSQPGLPVFEHDMRKLHNLTSTKATVDFHPAWLEAGAPRPLARFSENTYCCFACIGRHDSKGICRQDVARECAAYLPSHFDVLSLCPSTGPWAKPV